MTADKVFCEALAAAQLDMETPKLNKTNPHYKSKYADLAAIRAATLPALNKHGFALTQTTQIREDGTLVLVTRLEHRSGMRESEWPLPSNENSQAMGSALTYAKRYSWAALVGVAAEEDDDGNAAKDAKPAKREQKATPELPSRIDEVARLIEGTTPVEDVAAICSELAGEGAKVNDLTAQQYDELKNRLQELRKAAQ